MLLSRVLFTPLENHHCYQLPLPRTIRPMARGTELGRAQDPVLQKALNRRILLGGTVWTLVQTVLGSSVCQRVVEVLKVRKFWGVPVSPGEMMPLPKGNTDPKGCQAPKTTRCRVCHAVYVTLASARRFHLWIPFMDESRLPGASNVGTLIGMATLYHYPGPVLTLAHP